MEREDYIGLCALIGFFAILGSIIVGVIYTETYNEIECQKYIEIADWYEDNPELRKEIDSFMSDGKICRWEFCRIKRSHGWDTRKQFIQMIKEDKVENDYLNFE